MKVHEMFPRKYLTGEDLAGKQYTMVIEDVHQEEVHVGQGKTELKWAMRFQGARKSLLLNRTLADQLTQVTGSDDSAQWPGRAVTLFPMAMRVGGVDRVAIRLKAPEGPTSSSAPALDADDETEL